MGEDQQVWLSCVLYGPTLALRVDMIMATFVGNGNGGIEGTKSSSSGY